MIVSDPAPGPYGSASTTYLDAGWFGVLPLPAKAKHSPPVGWTGRDGGWPSRADVLAWTLGVEGDGNLGLRLPANVIGIDVDAYGSKAGRATIEAAVEKWGPLPPTWRSTSRDDGASGIYLFRVLDGLSWPGEVGPGVETIVWSHRYVVAPPSIHPEGRPYRWTRPDGVVVLSGIVPRVEELPELPDAWVAGLTRGVADVGFAKADLSDFEVSVWLLRYGVGDPCAAMREAVDHYVRRLTGEAGRHEAARDATARLFRLAAEGHRGGVAAVNEIAVAFRAAFGISSRSYDQTEWRRLYLGAIRLAAVDTDPAPPSDPCAIPTGGRVVEIVDVSTIPVEDAQAEMERRALDLEVGVQRRRRRARVILDDEAAASEIRRPPWRTGEADLAEPEDDVVFRVDRVLPIDGNVLLAATFKAGKTTVINHLARCLVDGRRFLGRFDVVDPIGRVALFNYEVAAGQYRRWLRDAGIDRLDRLAVWHLRGSRMPITSPKGADEVVAMLVEAEARVWIVDPFARAFSGVNENDNSEVARFLDALDVIKERAGVRELVLVTHTGRMVFEEGGERARGASRLDDWADVRWMLTKDENGMRYFSATGRDVEVAEAQLSYATKTRQLTLTGLGSRREANATVLENTVLAFVRQNPGCSKSRLEAGVDGKADYVRAALTALVKRSAVRLEKVGKSHDLYPIEPRVVDGDGE